MSIESVTLSTDEESVTLTGEAKDRFLGLGSQDRLIEVDPESVEEFEIAITGASGLECGDDLQIDQDVTVTVTGVVKEIRVGRRKRAGSDEEFIFRKAVIKADGAVVSRMRRRA